MVSPSRTATLSRTSRRMPDWREHAFERHPAVRQTSSRQEVEAAVADLADADLEVDRGVGPRRMEDEQPGIARRVNWARRKLHRGLEDAVALGVPTNQRFLADCLQHPVFAAGAATTAFIEQHGDELRRRDAEAEERAVALAALMLVESAEGAPLRGGGRRLVNSLPLRQRFEIDKARQDVTLVQHGHGDYEAQIGSRTHKLRLVVLERHDVRFECDGLVESAAWVRESARLLIGYRGRAYEIEDRARPSSSRREASAASDGKLRAAMNGRIVAVLVQVGERVVAGQPVLTLEAMKMEHLHAAAIGGVITALHAVAGEQVASQKLLVEIEPEEAATGPGQ